jgi:ATP-dependent helicase/nuclease subunit A
LGVDESATAIAKSLYEKSTGVSWVSIRTSHSFCFRLLERFPLETGLLPGVKLCDNYRLKQMMTESVCSNLADDFSDLRIIAEYTLDIFDLIKNNAMKICRFIDVIDTTEDLQKTYCSFFGTDPAFLDMSCEEIDNLLFQKFFQNNHRKIFAELAEGLSSGKKKDMENAEIFRRNAVNPSSDFLNAFLTKEKKPTASLYTQQITDQNIINLIRATARKAMDFWEAEKSIISAKTNIAFWKTAIKIMKKFQGLKIANHCLDFNDVILRTLDLLQSLDSVRYEIDSSIDHILVDEAQDTGPEQWEIIRIIAEEFFSHYQSNKTIFVVGDEKQSIYSFQGADVKLFREMRNYFAENVKKCGQDFYDKPLNKSYRTTGNILTFIDGVFAEKFPGISHSTNRNPNSGTVEIVDPFDDDESENASKKISQYIANLIKQSIDGNVWVESRQRTAKAEDFMILFQRRDTETMKYIIRALRKNGIPVSNIDKVLLNEELIVEDLIALAEFAVFPVDDLMCARVLKSPIVGMTENDLMHACINRKDESLWDYVCENYDTKNLKKYVDTALQLSAYDFFMSVLADGTKERIIIGAGGECIDVLYEFLGLVMNYERENTASLQSFLKWFRLFAAEHEIKRESFTDKSVVRLMTVHASKGLQSPFVILADTHFVKKNDKTNILNTADGLLLWDFSSRHRPKKVEELYAKQSESDDAESYRLLYVAATRAEDFLYILGEKHHETLPEKCWYSFLDRNKALLTKNADSGVGERAVARCVCGQKK